MTRRAGSWLFAPMLIGALSFGYSFTVAAQPAPAGGLDAGAARTDAGATAALQNDGGSNAAVEAGAPVAPTPSGSAPSVPTLTRKAPPLPPPTPQQIAAYEALRAEADVYERGARDYKDTITSIITIHYEEKKKTILAGLDREIVVEKAELKKAREIAIKRLEEFIAKYSGARAHPEATPDAMYRLAALYEEVARAADPPAGDDVVAFLAQGLKPAIRLYKRVINEFPNYREIAGIYYFLGHALNDSGRKPESQQVWRSLVCKNHYKYPTTQDPQDAERDVVAPLPQDNTVEYWRKWRNIFPTPASLKKGGADSKFVDPYPEDCAPVAQTSLRPDEEPKYVAEIWWQIGEWEFDQLDLGGGVLADYPSAVWDYNRAASAFQHSMKFKRPPLFGVALYKYAWTLFKQERFEAATREFIHLLNYTDEQQKLTGDPGADFRSEAFTYIAGSLVTADFVGPGPDEPYITREDIVTSETRPGQAEQKLKVAIDRVQDPKLIPQDKPWTIEIYRALALEYRALNHYASAITLYEKMLQKWPMDPSAPDTQNAIAEVYELQAKATKVGPERERYEGEVLKARTALAKYVGDTPWVDANKDNPAALQKAEELVRTGLKSAAISHTRKGQAAVDEAGTTDDRGRQVQLLETALSEYKLAAIGWKGYLKQDENAPDAYQSRYLYADALNQQVRIQVLLHQVDAKVYPEPTTQEIETAKQAAVDVRDSDEDDKFLDNAAFFVVDMSDVGRDLSYLRFRDSGGSQGVEARTEPRLEGPDGDKKVVNEPIPPVVQASMQARDEYVQHVPPQMDKTSRAPKYVFYVAEQYYVYGHFKEARDRFEPIYKERCGKDETGYEAWKRLITMSNLQRDAVRSRQLAEAEKSHSCAKTDVQKGDAKMIVDPTIQEAAFLDARRKFQEAQKAPPGPARDKLWREAAGMYEAALKAAPGRDEAPEAAMNAAYAYKQVGEFNKAIELYNLFIDKYGSDENLNRLQKGDPKTKTAPNVEKYKDRVDKLGNAYDALASTYYGFFNYRRAAEAFSKIAQNERFDEARRQNAARIAMILHANLGDRANMLASYGVLTRMKLPADKRAEADYRKADFDYAQWDPNKGDAGPNGAARHTAVGTLTQYYNANKANAPAARYVVEAAYKISKMSKSAGDAGYRTWLKNTIAAWQFFAKNPVEQTGPKGEKSFVRATDAPYSDYGAEADYTLVDEQIAAEFDAKVKKYDGTVVDVTKKYDADFELAEKKYRPMLDNISTTYQSFEWTPAAIARAGTLYDKLRSALELVVPQYFTPQQQALLDKLRTLGEDQKADEIEDAVRAKWREAKDQRLDTASMKAIIRYTQAALFARKNNVKNDAVKYAISRLAFFTDFLGDDKMKKYVEQTPDPNDPEPDPAKKRKVAYTNGMFLQWRSGLVSHPPPSGMPAPLPVAP